MRVAARAANGGLNGYTRENKSAEADPASPVGRSTIKLVRTERSE
jgi:hypothetical protein